MQDLQNLVKTFCDQQDWHTPIEHRFLDLTSEVGEVAKEILMITNYGKKPFVLPEDTTHLSNELGDVFFSLIAIANTCEIDLEASLKAVLQKYTNRINKNRKNP